MIIDENELSDKFDFDQNSQEQEIEFENNLRPKSLNEFVGQQHLKDNLKIAIEASKIRNEHLEHVLFYGPPGLGKTTLANIIANELGANFKTTSGPTIERSGDLASILTNLEEGDVLFIDEVHRMNKNVEEVLYPAMEDGFIDIMLGKGPGARSVRMDLPKFTIIAATTRAGLISNPLRDRFGHVFHLDFYNDSELRSIVMRSARILDFEIDESSATEIGQRSRSTPRIVNRILRRVRDYILVKKDSNSNLDHVLEALDMLGIDEIGLDKNDKLILRTIAETFKNQATGLKTLAIATGEAEGTITDIYEPYLIRQGLLQRTSKGRIVTDKGLGYI